MAGPPGPGRRGLGFAAAALIALVVVAIGTAGGFVALDRLLVQARAGLADRAPSGDVVVVAIDAASLDELDVWPWPRRYHAALLDRLADAGVARVAYDVEFNALSQPTDDAALARAAARLGPDRLAFAGLAQDDPNRGRLERLPFAALRAAAATVSVVVETDPDGRVRRFPPQALLGGRAIPTMPAWLAERAVMRPYRVDPSIDLDRIPHLSFADVLAGRVPAAALRGKRVLVGATALALGDRVAGPGIANLAGVQLLALATETLPQRRDLPAVTPGVAAFAAWAAALALLLVGPLARLRAGVLGFAGRGAVGLGERAAGAAELARAAELHTAGPLVATLLPLAGAALSRWIRLDALARELRGLYDRERRLVRAVGDVVPDGLIAVGPDGSIR